MSEGSDPNDPYRRDDDTPYGDDQFNLGAPKDSSLRSSKKESIDPFVSKPPSDSSEVASPDSSESTPSPQAFVRWKEEPDDFDAPMDEPVSFRGDKSDRESEMDMTPMVDVTFLLLIFFMVTASFTLQRSIEQPPQTEEEPSTQVVEDKEDPPDFIVVFVDEWNTFQVIYGDNEWECPSEQELIRRLRDVKENPTAGATPTELLVMAHAECLHERVVMAMDAGTEVGMASIQVTMTETGP